MQAWKVKKEQRIFNSPGLGAMGFGIPAAIGACIASGKKPVICIEGDGSFMMNIQELEVIKRLNLPIKIFVINNNGYGSIKSTQEKYFKGDLVGCTPESGLTLPDISLIAGGFEIIYDYMNTEYSLIDELKDIFQTWDNDSVICELEVYNHQTLPRTSAYQDENGKFQSAPMHDLYPFLDREEFNKKIIN
jgi:acetolactate synthase-1/2/3 large subunit